ncbi:MAG: BCD family MFS transporter, partial [Anaerolineales bacterium]|nr:BCD family MFS transporter [Anaerolineales bacterium]
VHMAVAMTLVPINSTLNRVMIKEFAISATLVAVMAILPYLISPIQVAVGYYSDRHPIWGLYRTPYILLGLLLCVAGLAVSPQIVFLIADHFWLGVLVGILAFGAWGMGYNLAAVSYLSLASELFGERGRGRTIAIMWFMMITGIILTAVTVSHLVDPYTEQALLRAFWIIASIALGLGLIGLVGLEPRSQEPVQAEERHSWKLMASTVWKNPQVRLFFVYLIILLAALLGQDILLEPYAAEAFDMPVSETTRITSLWGIFVLVALLFTGWAEARLGKRKTAAWGGGGALAGFVLITVSGLLLNETVFYLGVVLLGVGTGISTVSNLSLMLDMTVAGQVGLFIGAWGMANAISRLIGSLLAGMGRDLLTHLTANYILGYVVVFGILAGFMLISLVLLGRVDVRAFQQHGRQSSVVERAALASDL